MVQLPSKIIHPLALLQYQVAPSAESKPSTHTHTHTRLVDVLNGILAPSFTSHFPSSLSKYPSCNTQSNALHTIRLPSPPLKYELVKERSPSWSTPLLCPVAYLARRKCLGNAFSNLVCNTSVKYSQYKHFQNNLRLPMTGKSSGKVLCDLDLTFKSLPGHTEPPRGKQKLLELFVGT